MDASLLQFYTGFSLVDITATGVTRFRPEVEDKRNQHRNWETVLQAISLRSQPLYIDGPIVYEGDLNEGWEFGECYEGIHKIWLWTFAVEHGDVYKENSNPVAGLMRDFEQIPVITGLDETARFLLPIFHPYGAIKNIYFKPRAIDLNSV